MSHNSARQSRGNKRGKRGRGGHHRGRFQERRDDDMDVRPASAIDIEPVSKESEDEGK